MHLKERDEVSKIISFTVFVYIFLGFMFLVLFFVVPRFFNPVTANTIIETLPEPLKSQIEIEKVLPVPWSDEMYLVLAKKGVFSFYWSPNGYIVYGDVLVKEGRDFIPYASKVKQQFFEKKIKQVDLAKAIKIGNGTKQVVTFINPKCPYCKQGFEFFSKNGMTQYIFFMIFNEEDEKLFYSVICSSAMEEQMKQVFYNREKVLAIYKQDERCIKEKKDLLDYHKKIAETTIFSVPVYIIDDKVIVGFNENRIKTILN